MRLIILCIFLLSFIYVNFSCANGESDTNVHVMFGNVGNSTVYDSCLKVGEFETCSGNLSPDKRATHGYFNCPLKDNVVVTVKKSANDIFSQNINVSKFTSLRYGPHLTIFVKIDSDSKEVSVEFYDGLSVPY
ncbi:MAG: hypothetical protein R6W72_14515 [Desulfurivibrionaceae bacterium]